MPSLYDDLFEDTGAGNKKTNYQPKALDLDTNFFEKQGKESLDEIFAFIHQFTKQAEPFSKLLSNTRAVDHEVEKRNARLFPDYQR